MAAASRSLATALWGARFASGLLRLSYTTNQDTTRRGVGDVPFPLFSRPGRLRVTGMSALPTSGAEHPGTKWEGVIYLSRPFACRIKACSQDGAKR
jgi:hypothetical protein